MASIVEICNMALMRIGHSQTINDINEPGTTAAVLRTFYPMSRDHVLADADWGFARKRVSLALLPGAVSNWAFAYAYPADCLRVHGLVMPGMRVQRKDQKIPYESGFLNGVRVIFTDQEQAEAFYTARVEDPNLFQPLFITALSDMLASRVAMPLAGKRELVADCLQTYSARVEDPNLFQPLFITALSDMLASRVAMPLAGKRELVADCLQTYSAWIGQAKAANLNEGEDGLEPECEFLAVRR